MSLSHKTAELRRLVEEMVYQSRKVDDQTANGPHVDVSCQELRLLEHLGDSGPLKMRDLAEFLILAVNSVTSIVDNLERKKLVRRVRSDADRRVVHVELAESGRVVYKAALEEKMQIFRTMLGALNEDEQEIFMVLFRKIVRVGQTSVHTQRTATSA